MEQEQLRAEIEKLFAEADEQNVRYVSRNLERLVRQVDDPVVKARYEKAIDHLVEMVKFTQE